MDAALPIVVVTPTHIYEGSIAVAKRLQEVLNDELTDFVHMDNVSVVRLSDPDVTIHEAAEMSVAKGSMTFVLINTEQHEDPKTRVSHLMPKTAQPVFLGAVGSELKGLLHLTRRYDSPTDAMSLELHKFFAITDGVLSFPAVDDEPVYSPVVLANRSMLTALSIET